MELAKVISEPITVRNRLSEMGIEEDELLEALWQGFAAASECTANHPTIFRSLTFWGEATRALRDRLIPKGFLRANVQNLPITLNKEGTLAIIVATGDENTGRADMNPSTKSGKGPRTEEVVCANHLMNTLFGDIRTNVDKNAGRRHTYMLLFYANYETQEVRGELSLPLKLNDQDKCVDEWKERIILGSIPFNDRGKRLPASSDAPQTPQIEVEIKRRKVS